MKKENEKIEELNEMELLKLIYEIVKENSKNIKKLEERVGKLEERVEKIEERIEKIEEEIKYLDEKINKVYKELEEKINSTKNILVKEIAEELKNISAISSGRINNIEKKLDDEIEDRKVDVSKLKEFNRIIINDIRGRVSILEEESEKYNLK